MKKREKENEYMRVFWRNLEELTKKRSIPCAFACGRMLIPGEDLCPDCFKAYEKYRDENK